MEPGPILIIVCFIINFLACGTRFYIRVIKAKKHQLIEYILLLALVMQLALGSMQLRTFSLLPTVQDPLVAVEIAKLSFFAAIFYFGILWSVKISINSLHIQLTRGFKHINMWAVCSMYFLIGCVCFVIMMYLLACRPLKKRWALPSDPQCTPITHEWDFWTHLSLHILTDIILCILPFPVLLKITVHRLRIAICAVYSLAIISIIISITRAIILAVDSQDGLKKVMVLSTIEVTVFIVISVLPGISSTFTRKYLSHYSGSSQQEPPT